MKSVFLNFLNNICFSQIILLWKWSLLETPASSQAFHLLSFHSSCILSQFPGLQVKQIAGLSLILCNYKSVSLNMLYPKFLLIMPLLNLLFYPCD